MRLTRKELEHQVGQNLKFEQRDEHMIATLLQGESTEEMLGVFDGDDRAVTVEQLPLAFNRSECHGQGRFKGFYHRGANVFVVNQNALYLPLRAEDKDLYPSHADVSASEHVKLKETYMAAAVRGLEEELGKRVDEQSLQLLFTRRIEDSNNQEWAAYFLFESPTRDITLSSEAVSGTWVPIADLRKQGALEQIRFRPDHLPALREFLDIYHP